MEDFLVMVGEVARVVWIYATAWFILAAIRKRNDFADIAWGLGFVVICVLLQWRTASSPLLNVLSVMVLLWGVRLSVHIGLRSLGKPEDFRYRQWREAWGATVLWRSYLQVFLLQGFFMLIIALPVVWAAVTTPEPLSAVNYLGAGIWLVGYVIQFVADAQLAAFVKTKRPGEIMQTGLWRYSRHPNYFGEIVMWWGVFITITSLPGSGWLVVSPLLITWLLARVSGVPMLEAKYKDNPAYQEYKQRTSALVLWWRK